MKSLVANLWNYNNTQTADKEAQIRYAYLKHQQQLSKLKDVKKPSFDVEAPFQKKKRNVANSKLSRERQFVIEQENGALIHKMIEVKKKSGEYSKKQLIKSIESSTAPKSLFLPLKIATEKRVNSENIAMTNRVRNTNSTINFKTLDKEFEQSIKYKANITAKSRRIYNCFLLNGSTSSMMGKSSMSSSLVQSTRNERRHSQEDPKKYILEQNTLNSPPKKLKSKRKSPKRGETENTTQNKEITEQQNSQEQIQQTHNEEEQQQKQDEVQDKNNENQTEIQNQNDENKNNQQQQQEQQNQQQQE